MMESVIMIEPGTTMFARATTILNLNIFLTLRLHFTIREDDKDDWHHWCRGRRGADPEGRGF